MSKMYETIRNLAGDMTDTELCKLCGLSRSTLSELKKGRTEELSVKTLNKLAGFFNVPISVFNEDVQQKEKSVIQTYDELYKDVDYIITQLKMMPGEKRKDRLKMIKKMVEDI